jgi:hypothetical protein
MPPLPRRNHSIGGADHPAYGRPDVGRWSHRYDIDTDRCTCGGLIVFFEDGDRNGETGEGCEVAGIVWAAKCEPGGGPS